MCGRYVLSEPSDVVGMLEPESAPPLVARYNIAPTQSVPVVRARRDTGRLVVRNLRWGLVPSWAKDLSIGNRMINARGETVAEKPAFRAAFTRRRCGVLADGFVEWRRQPDGKQPFLVRRVDGGGFLMAGLWERWKRGEDGPVDSFTIVTTTPNGPVSGLHDRMPAILDPSAWSTWLDPAVEDVDALRSLIGPAPDDLLTLAPISRRINNVRHDDPDCLAPADA